LEPRTPPNQELSEFTVRSNMSFAPMQDERSEFSFNDDKKVFNND